MGLSRYIIFIIFPSQLFHYSVYTSLLFKLQDHKYPYNMQRLLKLQIKAICITIKSFFAAQNDKNYNTNDFTKFHKDLALKFLIMHETC